MSVKEKDLHSITIWVLSGTRPNGGVLQWTCELGRLDILHPMSLMLRCLAQAREGHLNQMLRIFACFKCHGKSKLVMDPCRPRFDESRFQECDWSEFYPEAGELVPPGAPKALRKAVVMSCFTDADLAGCLETRRSHSGIIIFCNRAPILWFSKRQTTGETSTL